MSENNSKSVATPIREEYILDCSGLSKAFGGTQALKSVDLRIKKGQVHALMGENGAGKSTLMKIIIGLYKADEGTITFEGDGYNVSGPSEAINAGISMIHQELNLEPHLTIAESIFLNREDVKGLFLDKKKTNAKADALLKSFNFNIPYNHMMKEITLAHAQMVEIMKAVSCNARLVIMDEPTSSLDSEETERLFKTIRELQASGVTIIYISHRMEEIFGICDSYTVFRDGQSVATGNVADVCVNDLIEMMVGHEVNNIFPKTDCQIGEVVLKVENLCGKGFHDISFEVREGEILGLTGLVGSGRSETMRAIFGLDKLKSGNIYMHGKPIVNKTPYVAIKNGIAMVNEDRKKFGAVLSRSIKENISLPNLPVDQPHLFINGNREKEECIALSNQFRVKSASVESTVYSLSGGNQQKVVLAKWIKSNPKLLILDEPTRGVDVGAKAEIHTLMCELAANGLSIIMISSELPEVLGMSDRVLIYHEGRLNGEVSRKQLLSGEISKQDILKKEFGE